MALKCPYCGNVNEPKAKYCSVCGGPANQIIVPIASVPGETSKRNGGSRLVSAMVYVIIIVMILSVPAYLTIRTVVDVTTTAVDLSVTDATYVAANSSSIPPEVGYRFVHLTATITNIGGGTIAMTPLEFHIQTTRLTYYDFTNKSDYIVPETLTGGSTATLSITFEIPVDEIPYRLSYQPFMTSDVIESDIGYVRDISQSNISVLVADIVGSEEPVCKSASCSELK